MSARTPFSSIIIGQGALAIQCAQTLVSRGHKVLAIVSPDAAVASWANEHRIVYLASLQEVLPIARREAFDYLFSIINYAVLPQELLQLPQRAAINYHDAPLPRYAGLNATSWALFSGESSHAVSWHQMSDVVDGGDLFKQKRVEIGSLDTAFTLNGRCFSAALEAFSELVEELEQGRAVAVPQNLRQRSYFGKHDRPAAACLLNWSRPARELDALVRALDFGASANPLGLPKVFCAGQFFLVIKGTANALKRSAPPGTISAMANDALCVATAEGDFEIRQVMDLDGEPLTIAELVSRFGLDVGSSFPGLLPSWSAELTESNRRICRFEDYWVKRLVQFQPYVLPLSRRIAPERRGAQRKSLPIALPGAFQGAANSWGVDWTNACLAAFGAFLARIAGLSSFDLGLRASTGLSEFGSLFSSHVPLRVEADVQQGIAPVAVRLRDELAAARKRLTFSREAVVRHPQLRSIAELRKPNKWPVVVEIAEGPFSESLPAGVDLAFALSSSAAEGRWIYDDAVLDGETIRQLAGHFVTFLGAIAENPNAVIADLPLLSQLEWNKAIQPPAPAQVGAASHIPLDGNSTLAALFEAQAARTPDALALTYEGRSWTYAQVNAQANRLAHHLVQHGVGPDTLVGLCVDRSNHLVVALLAILKSGGAYLPLDLTYPADRVAFILEDARAPVLVTEGKLLATLPSLQTQVVCVDEILDQPCSDGDEENLPARSGPDHLAYIIYTSGTTGRPKGSQITHRNVVRLFAATENWYQFDERDVWTLFHSSAFDFSVWEIWGALLYGGRVIVIPFHVSRSPEAFYDLLAREHVTVLNQTPSAFRQLIHAEGAAGQRELALRYVIFGGEALEMQSLKPWFNRHGDVKPKLINMYGITETTVHVTYRPLSKDDVDSGSVIGVPISDLRVYILDEQRRPVPLGIPGEMYVSGGGLARGYLRRPDLTAQRFVRNPFRNEPGSYLYRTGDLARFLPAGDIEYLGRIDDQVKVRGFRIELGEIESVLCEHPAVREVAVIAREDEPGAKQLVAYVVSHSPALEARVLREHLRKKVPEYMVPAAFLFLERLPLTSNGKVDRTALPVPAKQESDPGVPYVAPQTATEKRLAAIWSSVLQREQVSVQDNFFDLGGHSMLLVRTHLRLREELNSEIPIVTLFEHPTIRSLANYLDGKAEGPAPVQDGWEDRARKQKQVLLQMRSKQKKGVQ